MNFIGIDPGNEGFISIIKEDGATESWPMPLNHINKVDASKLFKILSDIKGQYFVEEVHAVFGSSAESTFSFGYSIGKLHAVLEVLGIDYNLVQPKAWQKVIWQGYETKKVKSKKGLKMVNDTKGMSVSIAKDLFPEVDLRKNSRCRTPHDGKSDSLLIAEYGRRMYNTMKGKN